MALVQHHTDSSMKCKKNPVFLQGVFFSYETDQEASAQIFFFFLFVSCCVFHFAGVEFYPAMELG